MPARINIREWQKHAEQARYSVARFARRTRLHPRTLQRLVRKTFGQTVKQWFNQMRLNRALVLARKGKGTIEIARTLHFKSVPSFCREFKRAHGKAVTEFHPKKRIRKSPRNR